MLVILVTMVVIMTIAMIIAIMFCDADACGDGDNYVDN